MQHSECKMTERKEFGVFIGRFQPFHNAHLETVQQAVKQVEKLIIVIGSASGARTVKNPWTSTDRIKMISEAIIDLGIGLDMIQFIEAKDYLYNDNRWVTGLQASMEQALNGYEGEVLLFGHNKDRSTHYLKLFPQWTFIDTGSKGNFDATKVRGQYFRRDTTSLSRILPPTILALLQKEIGSGEYERLYSEYHHIIDYQQMWEDSPFPPIFVTTDVILIKSGHVLVVRRKGQPGRGLVALPGGFLSQNERIVDGALRELKEETGIRLPKDELKKRIIDNEVFDHPDRSLRGRTITHAYCIDLGNGDLPKVKGADDAEKAWWMSLRDVYRNEEMFFEDHFHILTHFVSKY